MIYPTATDALFNPLLVINDSWFMNKIRVVRENGKKEIRLAKNQNTH